MNVAGISNVLDRIEDVLLIEKDLLLSGRARETASMTSEKMEALQAFEDTFGRAVPGSLAVDDQRRVQGIIALARENAMHFAAVRNGLQSAISRIQGSNDEAYVGAYRLDGRQTAFSNAVGNYAKKA